MKGIVKRSTGSWYTVIDESGNNYHCKLKGQFRLKEIKSTNPIAVGDHVEFNISEVAGINVIDKIYERHNYIIRKATRLSKVSHIIASNIDLMAIIISMEQPRTSTGFIDRILVTAEAYHIPAALIFNKIDLYSPDSLNLNLKLTEVYTQIGYTCFSVSALTGQGMDVIEEYFKDKVTLLAGHSGVGKSAIINALDSSLNLRTGKISSYHNKGMHTTTFAELFPLPSGGYIIDSPGIKEFGLVHFGKQEIGERFPEFRALLPSCRFYNCTHVHEPDCAVKDAVNKGLIYEGRYRNYLSILNDDYYEKFM